MKRARLALVFALLALALLFRFGGSLWHSVWVRIKGARTVEEVVRELDDRNAAKVHARLQDAGFSDYPSRISIVAIKHEKVLEVWGANMETGWRLVQSVPFTGTSGKLGPKLKEGDRQIPEGIYGIEYLNPNSRFHLSMKIDYPNEFDREMARRDGRTNLGNDIMIHGSFVTVGCIPIGDDRIEEVFLLVAKAGIENTRVIISPVDPRKAVAFPEIDSVDWENELYELIRKVIGDFLVLGGR